MGKYGIIPGSKEDVFGFDPGKGRFEQLKTVLKMDNENDIDELRDEINRLAHKHLNMKAKLNTRFQRAALDELENELLVKRPNLWGGPDSDRKLYFARRAAMTVHWAKKHSSATKQKENSLAKVEKNRVASPTKSESGTGFSSDLTELEDSDDEASDDMARLALLPHELKNQGGQSSSMPGTGLADDPIIIEDDEEVVLPQAQRETLATNDATTSADVACLEPKTFISHFLSSCKPPMDHHLQLFEDFGPHADWATTIRSLSFDWSARNRQDLLRQILGGLEKNLPVMELDIAILENHFKTYFL